MKIRRLFSLGVIVLATMLVLTLGSGVASAADFCRTDPILHLSNGKTLTLATEIGTSPENVKRIDYKVTLPRDVKVLSTEYPAGDPLVAKEFVTVHSTGKPGEYKTQVNVATKKRVDVTFQASLDALSKEVEGKTGRALVISFTAK